jgi:endonuclease-8
MVAYGAAMPEGDTIHRTAARLAPLVGEQLIAFEARTLRGVRPRLGETIESVTANGKHLLVAFSGGLTLDTHLGMTGVWRLQPAGTPTARARHLIRVHLGVAAWDAYCFQAPTIRTFPTATDRSPIAHLGPDLASSDADLDECLRRWRELAEPDALVADVLLDQRVANGVGNVYVSEACWRIAVAPHGLAASVDDRTRRDLLAAAHTLLLVNLESGRRRTVPGGYAVYDRRGRACRRCGSPISSGRIGRWQRTAYWCPHCQVLPEGQTRGQ